MKLRLEKTSVMKELSNWSMRKNTRINPFHITPFQERSKNILNHESVVLESSIKSFIKPSID